MRRALWLCVSHWARLFAFWWPAARRPAVKKRTCLRFKSPMCSRAKTHKSSTWDDGNGGCSDCRHGKLKRKHTAFFARLLYRSFAFVPLCLTHSLHERDGAIERGVHYANCTSDMRQKGPKGAQRLQEKGHSSCLATPSTFPVVSSSALPLPWAWLAPSAAPWLSPMTRRRWRARSASTPVRTARAPVAPSSSSSASSRRTPTATRLI